MSETLVVHEIYLSLQGESGFAGWPCILVRLTGCDLRCCYCDTAYAFYGGRRMTLPEVLGKVEELSTPYQGQVAGCGRLPLVELTGGEPLLQPGSRPLLRALCDAGFTVLLETSGAHAVEQVDPRVHRIMDLKCPGSGEAGRNRWQNLSCLGPRDQIKFVLGSVEDYDWVKRQIAERGLASICPLLVSWAEPLSPAQRADSLKPAPAEQTPLSRRELAERVLADHLPVRYQLQMHKHLWPPDQRGT